MTGLGILNFSQQHATSTRAVTISLTCLVFVTLHGQLTFMWKEMGLSQKFWELPGIPSISNCQVHYIFINVLLGFLCSQNWTRCREDTFPHKITCSPSRKEQSKTQRSNESGWSEIFRNQNPINRFLRKFLLLFYYSCPNFAPFAFLHRSHPLLPQSIPILLSMSVGHSYMFFD